MWQISPGPVDLFLMSIATAPFVVKSSDPICLGNYAMCIFVQVMVGLLLHSEFGSHIYIFLFTSLSLMCAKSA